MDRAPRCWNCDYDLTGVEVGAPCPECGEPHDPEKGPRENLILGYAALTTGLGSLFLSLEVALYSIGRTSVRMLIASLALMVITDTLARMSCPYRRRWLSVPFEKSPSSLGRVFAVIALLLLILEWVLG